MKEKKTPELLHEEDRKKDLFLKETSASYAYREEAQGSYTKEDYYALPPDVRAELIDAVEQQKDGPAADGLHIAVIPQASGLAHARNQPEIGGQRVGRREDGELFRQGQERSGEIREGSCLSRDLSDGEGQRQVLRTVPGDPDRQMLAPGTDDDRLPGGKHDALPAEIDHSPAPHHEMKLVVLMAVGHKGPLGGIRLVPVKMMDREESVPEIHVCAADIQVLFHPPASFP